MASNRLFGALVLLNALGCSGASSPAGADALEAVEARVADVPDVLDASADLANAGPCTVLFGVPNEKTGLTPLQCQPRCARDGRTFEPPVYTEAQIAALEARVLVNPFATLESDPYAEPGAHVPVEGAICGVLPEPSIAGGYRLATYASRDEALAAGARIGPFNGHSPREAEYGRGQEPAAH
jgi:hypothetical protein